MRSKPKLSDNLQGELNNAYLTDCQTADELKPFGQSKRSRPVTVKHLENKNFYGIASLLSRFSETSQKTTVRSYCSSPANNKKIEKPLQRKNVNKFV